MASAPKCGRICFEELSTLPQELNTLEVSEKLLNAAETLLRHYPQRQENNNYKKLYDLLGGIFTESLAVVHKVKVHAVSTGETFGADNALLSQVNNCKDLQVEITDLQGSNVIILFCPITSCVVSEETEAMEKVLGDKPIIRVLIHLTQDPDYSPCGENQDESSQNGVQDVRVFYNDREKSLLQCDKAVQQMQNMLLQYSISMVTKSPGTQNQTQDLEKAQSSNSTERLMHASPVLCKVKVHTITTGKTFGADDALLNQVSNHKNLQVESTDLQRSNITILFCPITSRVGSDVKAAMKNIKCDKPVILVQMHHTRKPDYSCGEYLDENFQNIVQKVHVLYHENMQGLLTCSKNNEAVQQMQEMLLQFSSSIMSMVSDNQGTQDQWYQNAVRGLAQSSSKASTQSNAVVHIVKVHTVTTGKTFGADDALLNQVSNQKDLRVERTDLKRSNIIILFCPITYDAGSDVKAAMRNITCDKPVILVLMHHTRKPDYSCRENLDENLQNVVQNVHVLYHENMKGLLTCSQNNEAVQQIQEMLLQYSSSSITTVTNSQGTQSSYTNQLPQAQVKKNNSSSHSTYKFWQKQKQNS